jgi:hypothetical protein
MRDGIKRREEEGRGRKGKRGKRNMSLSPS